MTIDFQFLTQFGKFRIVFKGQKYREGYCERVWDATLNALFKALIRTDPDVTTGASFNDVRSARATDCHLERGSRRVDPCIHGDDTRTGLHSSLAR